MSAPDPRSQASDSAGPAWSGLTSASGRGAFLRSLHAAARWLRSREARADFSYEWRRLWRGEPALPWPRPRSILVLCTGNLCRSPFAARLLAARLDGVRVRSAGLRAALGHPADPTAAAVAAEFGVRLDDHRTQPAKAPVVEAAELILAFEGRQLAELERRFPDARAPRLLLGDFLPAPPRRIEDPWGRGEEVFRRVFARIRTAAERLADRFEDDPP